MAVMSRLELEHRAGGTVAQNSGRVYSLSDAHKLDLAGLGVDADALLAQMNAQTIYAADRNARNVAVHYVDSTGNIKRPVLTIHTKGDPLTPDGAKGIMLCGDLWTTFVL